MANFGETLTYWYLRLNGFFPLTNFVLHRHEEPGYEATHRADTDLLAVRFKHVYEPVGGQADDWDEWFAKNQIRFANKVVGLIVEVKTGDVRTEAINRSFSEERLTYAIQRLGFYDSQKGTIGKRVESLQKKAFVTNDYYQIAKVLVTSAPVGRLSLPPCLNITLPEIETFISKRMRKYAQEKSGSRFFFPDDLIQYFAWKSHNT